jgi:hypothetical protein
MVRVMTAKGHASLGSGPTRDLSARMVSIGRLRQQQSWTAVLESAGESAPDQPNP